MSGRSKLLVCLDWDGVVHAYTSGWKGVTEIPDGPVPGAMEFIIEAQPHFTIAIYSSRSGQEGGIAAMEGALRHWLFMHLLANGGDECKTTPECRDRVQEIVGRIQWPVAKPAAFITLDDRALTFLGVWPSIKELQDFVPWNKRPVPTCRSASSPCSHQKLNGAGALCDVCRGPLRFRRRHSEIEAVQWQEGMTHQRVVKRDDDSVFVPEGDVATQRGHVIVPGDWIVTDPAGDGWYVVEDRIFQRRYEALT